MITRERQQKILSHIVQEYIKSAKPVSSKKIAKDCGFNVVSSTIRNDMQALTDDGFLFQPHTSSGRVPTDKAYRFFVDQLYREGFFDKKKEIQRDWTKEDKDTLKLIQDITKDLASLSSGLVVSHLSDGRLFWKEGWDEIFQEPEFRKIGLVQDFIKFLDNFEGEIKSLEPDSGVKVYIGKESRVPKSQNFSIIISECYFPEKEKGWISILGPKRMAYGKNIALIDSFKKLMEDF